MGATRHGASLKERGVTERVAVPDHVQDASAIVFRDLHEDPDERHDQHGPEQWCVLSLEPLFPAPHGRTA